MVSTPNLNFLAGALSDPAFRDSVLESDLCLADGMPLVWVARALGLPIRSRVAGSDLFAALAKHPGPPLRVYFFGGPDGAAQAACERVNANAHGLRCVGFDSPGFVSIEAMSDAPRIARINGSGAQFVVAALGARKGQAWLRHNRAQLRAPVLCHLGAVVNFAAGRVRRAPAWLQRLGLEWLWRIGQEPALWRRYAGDGLALLRLMATRVLPLMRARDDSPAGDACITSHAAGGHCTLTLRGGWTAERLAPLRAALAQAAASAGRLTLVLRDATHVDSAFIGLLMLAPRAFAGGVDIVEASPRVARLFRLHCADFLLAPARGSHA